MANRETGMIYLSFERAFSSVSRDSCDLGETLNYWTRLLKGGAFFVRMLPQHSSFDAERYRRFATNLLITDLRALLDCR